MLVGAIALIGVFPFAGFWAKDEILAGDFVGGYYVVWAVGIITALLTAIFVFRLIFMTFFGESRAADEVQPHIHESPKVMTIPLVLLAIPAALLGLVVGWPPEGGWIHDVPRAGLLRRRARGVRTGSARAAGSWCSRSPSPCWASYVAYVLYIRRTELPGRLAERLPVAYKASFNKMYMDQVYEVVPIRSTIAFAGWLWTVLRRQGHRRRRQRARAPLGALRRAPAAVADRARAELRLLHLRRHARAGRRPRLGLGVVT